MSRTLFRSALQLTGRLPRPALSSLPLRQCRPLNQTSHVVEPAAGSAPPPFSQATSKPLDLRHEGESPAPSDPIVIQPSAASRDDSGLTPLAWLAAQPSHYITIHIHGQPFLVTVGDKLRLPFKMPKVQPGDILRLDKASVLGSRDFTLKGAPYINSDVFECRAVVLGTESEPMRIKIKKKQRTRRKKHVRSKHQYTILRINELKIKP